MSGRSSVDDVPTYGRKPRTCRRRQKSKKGVWWVWCVPSRASICHAHAASSVHDRISTVTWPPLYAQLALAPSIRLPGKRVCITVVPFRVLQLRSKRQNSAEKEWSDVVGVKSPSRLVTTPGPVHTRQPEKGMMG